MMVLSVYIDDIIITRDDEEEIKQMKDYLAKEFEMKDLKHLKYFIGMEITRSSKRIHILQIKYTLDLFKEIGMLRCKPCETSFEQNEKFMVNGEVH